MQNVLFIVQTILAITLIIAVILQLRGQGFTGTFNDSTSIHRTRPTHDVEVACDVLDAYLAAVEQDTEPDETVSREMFTVSMAYLAGVREARELLSGVLVPGPLPRD